VRGAAAGAGFRFSAAGELHHGAAHPDVPRSAVSGTF
jgi:hypothetical protein